MKSDGPERSPAFVLLCHFVGASHCFCPLRPTKEVDQRAARTLPRALANGLSGSGPAWRLVAKSAPSLSQVQSLARSDGRRSASGAYKTAAAAHFSFILNPRMKRTCGPFLRPAEGPRKRFSCPVANVPLAVWVTSQATVTMDTTSWWLLCQPPPIKHQFIGVWKRLMCLFDMLT